MLNGHSSVPLFSLFLGIGICRHEHLLLSTLLYLFTLSLIYVHTCRTFYKNFSKRADVQILSLPPDQQATLDKQGIFEIVYRKSSPKPYPRGLISFNQLKGGLLERGFIENLWYVRETIYWGLGVLAS